MKKIVFAIILECIVLFGLGGCGKQNESVKENAQVAADAFTDGDMETIHKIMFGMSELEIDGKLTDIWGENIEPQEGILEYIFKRVTVKVKKTTDSTIEYVIEAPDMNQVFVEIDTNAANISEDELLQYIKNYAQNADTKKTVVSLAYILVDEEPIVDYQNEEFVNAVTGGLLDAYRTLYVEMLEEYEEGVN